MGNWRGRSGTWSVAVAALAAGLVHVTVVGAHADSAWPTEHGDAQGTRQGVAEGPLTPAVKWSWSDPNYVSDGSIGNTWTHIPGVLDEAGRVLFKARDTRFDEREGEPTRYDLLGLDPATGEHEIVLPDVQSDYCVPAVGPDGTIWALQEINSRTDPGTEDNPAHGEHGHVALTHHPEAASWVVGIDPETDEVVHRYSGEGVVPPDHSSIGNCVDSFTVTPDGTVVWMDVRGDLSPGGFEHWLRALNADGTPKWQVSIDAEYGEPRHWGARSGTEWQLIAREGSPGEGTLYLGYRQEDPDSDAYHPGIAAFDLDTGALIDTLDLPGRRFRTDPVIDPDGGILLSIDDPELGSDGSGHLLRLVDDGTAMSVDWHQRIARDRDREDSLKAIPNSLQIAGERVVAWSGYDYLVSFAWVDGEFGWRVDPGLDSTTEELLVDAAGNAFVAMLGASNKPRMVIYSPTGELVGELAGDQTSGLRTLGPLAADGTLYVWGDDTWWALEHDPEGAVPCPEGTSATVTCQRNPAGGYVMRGTGEAEVFVGSGQPDKMVGRGGDDLMRGRGGEDLLRGGGGDDRLIGNGRADDLFGQRGADHLRGGSGRDRFVAGPGRDVLQARGQRRERVNCGGGRDRVRGARGDRVRANCERVRR